MYFQLLKFFFDISSLENIVSDIVPNVSNKYQMSQSQTSRKKFVVNTYSGYDLYEIICNTIIIWACSKIMKPKRDIGGEK